jgi:haloalkane dehalogenase
MIDTLRPFEQLEFCRHRPSQREITVPGGHFVQEDSPDETGSAIVAWLQDRHDEEAA